MKKIFSIFSALVFLFGAAGYYLAFTTVDKNIKHEMAELIEWGNYSEKQIQLSFSQEELQREIHFTKGNHKEFIYRGEHYDVIDSQTNGNRISFTCLADEKETSLFASLKKQINEQSTGNNSSGKSSVKPVAQDWFFQTQSPPLAAESSVLFAADTKFFLPETPFRIPSPPPKA